MTVLYWLDDDKSYYMRERAVGDGTGRFTVAVARAAWQGSLEGLDLIAAEAGFGSEPRIQWMCRVRGGGQVSTFDRLVSFEELYSIDPPVTMAALAGGTAPTPPRGGSQTRIRE